jgi:ribonuclease T2
MSLAAIVLLSFISLPLIIHSLELPIERTKVATRCLADQSFGYVLLAIQWAPSFCNSTACGDRNKNMWTIHGSWPQHTNNSWPQYCCFEKDFNVTNIKSLESQLIQKWPSLKASGTHQSFWEHEWTKHGSCAMNSNPLKGQLNYFNYSLHLYDSFPLQSWLQSSNIVPHNNNAYKLTAIHESVEKKLGKKVELECLKKSPYPLLQHIYICLDKTTLKPIDCTRSDDTQCGTGSVLIPTVS